MAQRASTSSTGANLAALENHLARERERIDRLQTVMVQLEELAGRVERFLPVGRRHDLVALGLEEIPEQVADGGLVLGDEEGLRHQGAGMGPASPCGGRSPRPPVKSSDTVPLKQRGKKG